MITFLVCIILFRALVRYLFYNWQCPRQIRQAPKINSLENSRCEKEKIRSEKEQIKAEKEKQKRQQAQADKQFLEEQLESIGDLILQVDDELNRVNQKISIDIQLKSYDTEQKDRKRREQIIKKLLALERQQHAAEAKLAKANYILQDGK